MSLDKAIVAHIEIKGERFEILVDGDQAYSYKEGRKKDFDNVLMVEEVFTNAKKAERPTKEQLKKAFGMDDMVGIAKTIIEKGEVQITTERRKKMVEERGKKIIAILSRECIDPRTGAPHPPQRIEGAMEEARIHLDPFKSAEEQIGEVIEKLKLILPLKFQKVSIAVRVPAHHAQKSYGIFKEYGVQKEEWQKDGSLIILVEIPAGVQDEFYNRINKMTGGEVETKLIKK